ncbi:MAG: DUF1186 domain-containing protein [Planctomycetes bacterium]|nr:DUF1186 domain-containing protein [Planctomycetota bacterium]
MTSADDKTQDADAHSPTPSNSNSGISADIDAILKELDSPFDVLPEHAFPAARLHRDQIIPGLIGLIEKAVEDTKCGRRVETNGHFFALFLLAEFRAAEALPAILEAVSLPGEKSLDLYDDAITESLHRVLAALAWDKVDQIVIPLIQNKKVNEYARRAGATSLVSIVAAGLRPRDEVVTILRQLLRDAVEGREESLIDALVINLCDLCAADAIDEIKELFDRGLIDEMTIDWKGAEAELRRNPDASLAKLLKRPVFFEDSLAELKTWAAFEEENDQVPTPPPILSPPPSVFRSAAETPVRTFDPPFTHSALRVGRNDPCPCGSGKKFKKCCGAKR